MGGTALGQRHSVVLANIFMSYMLERFFRDQPAWKAHLPLFKRFLDDIVLWWHGSYELYVSFVACLNTWSSLKGYKVQFKISGFGGPLDFLDLQIYKNSIGEWHTRLFCKATDIHAYVLPTSCHPPAICKAIPKSIAIRIFRACCEIRWFTYFWTRFRDIYFTRRGYQPELINKVFRLVRRLNRADILKPKGPRNNQSDRVNFVIPYGSNTKKINQVLKDMAAMSQARHLYKTSAVKYPQRPCFRVGKNLKARLVRASVVARERKPHGCFRCNDVDCPLDHLMSESTVVKSASPEVFNIRQHLTCNTKNVVYSVRCTQCNVFGVGECEDPKERLVKYIQAARSTRPLRRTRTEKHFADSFHTPADLEFTLIDSIPSTMNATPACIPAERVRLEELWINKLNAQLNKKRQVHFSFTGQGYARHEAGDDDD